MCVPAYVVVKGSPSVIGARCREDSGRREMMAVLMSEVGGGDSSRGGEEAVDGLHRNGVENGVTATEKECEGERGKEREWCHYYC